MNSVAFCRRLSSWSASVWRRDPFGMTDESSNQALGGRYPCHGVPDDIVAGSTACLGVHGRGLELEWHAWAPGNQNRPRGRDCITGVPGREAPTHAVDC